MTTLHGEYKVIGGKLVAADLSLADGRIATASINGDFLSLIHISEPTRPY